MFKLKQSKKDCLKKIKLSVKKMARSLFLFKWNCKQINQQSAKTLSKSLLIQKHEIFHQ